MPTSLSPPSVLPDVNVWLALFHGGHSHHLSAKSWYEALDPFPIFCFCRQTQLGLLRLLSTSSVMGGSPLNLAECWRLYALWTASGQAKLLNEPNGLELVLHSNTRAPIVAPKLWADAYLAAFAQAANLTLVTFDRALASKTSNSILLS